MYKVLMHMQFVKHPKSFLITFLFFVSIVIVTLLIAKQQQKIKLDDDQQELVEAGSHVKDEFTHIVYSNITAAQTMRLLVEQDPNYLKNFDKYAQTIIASTKHIDAIQITLNGKIKCVFPKQKYSSTLGINTTRDSIRLAESKRAFQKGIFIAGPRPLREGGIGILAKVPIQTQKDSLSICVILTRITSIQNVLNSCQTFNSSKFSFWLTKLKTDGDSTNYFLSSTLPYSLNSYSTEIPEGDWLFNASYSNTYNPPPMPLETIILGLFLAIILSVLIYYYTTQPARLESIINEKTALIKQQEYFHKTLIQNITDAIVLLNSNGEVVYQSPSTEQISGYTLNEVRQFNPTALIHPDDIEKDHAEFTALTQTPYSYLQTKHRLKHKNGNYIWIQAQYVNLLQEHGINAILLSYRDITAQVNAMEAERFMSYNLQERVKELSTIYKVNLVLQDEKKTRTDRLSEIVQIIPDGWQYPSICSAKISLANQVYQTANYTHSNYNLTYTFSLNNGEKACLEVSYSEDHSFLPEEHQLIKSLGDTIKLFIDNEDSKEAMIASEQKFRMAFESASIGVVLTDIEGNFQLANDAFCNMVGYHETELINLNFSKITHPDDLLNDYNFLNRVETENAVNYDTLKRFIHKLDKSVWVKLHATLIKPENAKPYFVALIEDVSEKLEAEMKFQNLVDNSNIGIYIIQNNKFVYVNPKLEEYAGYSQNELLNIDLVDLIDPEFKLNFSNLLYNREQGQLNTINYTIKALRKDQSNLWVEIHGSTTTYQGKRALIGTVVDVTKSKELLSKIQDSEANVRSIIDNSETSFLLTDSNLNLLVVSKNTFINNAPLFSCEPSLGKRLYECCITNLVENLSYLIDYVTTSLISHTFDFASESADSKQYYSITASPVISHTNLIGFSISIANVTEKKVLEFERLRIMNERKLAIEELTKRNKDLTQFSYIVSHNVRAPLANIIGLTSIAMNDDFDKDTKLQTITRINTSAKILDSVLMDINEILKVNNVIAEAKSIIHFEEKVMKTKLLLIDDIRKTQTTITTDFAEANSIISIKSFMQSVFYNLISNSIKHRKKGSQPMIEIWSRKLSNNTIELHFKDNSIGIDTEAHGEKVFGLYRRFNTEVEGKGLGLFMIKTQLEKLGGQIKLESSLGKGCHFTIILPLD